MRFKVITEFGTYFHVEDVAKKKFVSNVLADRAYIESMCKTLERQVSINGQEEVFVVTHGVYFYRLKVEEGVATLHKFMLVDSIPEEENTESIRKLPAIAGETHRETLLRFQKIGFPIAYSYHYTPVPIQPEGVTCG